MILKTLEGVDLDIIMLSQTLLPTIHDESTLKELCGTQPTTSTPHHSHRKQAQSMESPTLFSRQYIFCDAIEKKVGSKTVLYKLIYHLSCIKSFKAEYCNRMRAEARTQVTSSDTEQAHIPAAHEETYSSAIQFINDNIPRENRVIPLSLENQDTPLAPTSQLLRTWTSVLLTCLLVL